MAKTKDTEKVGTSIKKCPGCGANMRFNADIQMLYCDHCQTKVPVGETKEANELDLADNISKDAFWEQSDAVVFHCDNCGAKVVLSEGETAKICPFCGTSHVQKTAELAGLKPNGVLPFLFGEEKAIEYGKKWAKKRLFAPRKFKKNLSADNVKGVYTPCFTFDSYTTSTYVGRVGYTRTRTVGSGNNRRTETYTEWRNISGTHYENFDDLLITAGSKFDQKRLDKISPYETNASREYKEAFLFGFMAYRYDKELSDCWDEAKTRMDKIIRQQIINSYHCDTVDYLNVSTSHEKVTFKYVMLPVYIGNFTFKQKLYNFFINGTNGKVKGKAPVSFWRVFFTVLLGIAVVVGGVLAYFLTK